MTFQKATFQIDSQILQQLDNLYCIIGIRPTALTRWGILDIGINSAYHPQNNPSALSLSRA